MELSQAQKADRQQQGARRRLEVTKDAVWWDEHRRRSTTEGAHFSHAMCKLGQYFFCTACGHHGAQKLVALAAPCPRTTTPSRKYLLKRLLAGLHPRTGEHIGEVERVQSPAAGVQFSVTNRRSRMG